MIDPQFVSRVVRHGACCAVALLSFVSNSTSASAAMVEIGFTGMNLFYDGSAIYDGGSVAGGVANPADADPLVSVDIVVGGVPFASISSDISLDVFIPDVVGIPSAAGTVHNLSTPGNSGYFDLLLGTSPLASEFLLVDLEEVSVTYVDVANIVQFTFGAAISDSFAQNLPFGLVVGDPVTVSFSAQIAPGTRTTNLGFITGFNATGTGEFRGELVPEPSTVCMLAAVGFVAVFARRK